MPVAQSIIDGNNKLPANFVYEYLTNKVGFCIVYPQTVAPQNYIECNGTLLSTTTYATLYASIGRNGGSPTTFYMNTGTYGQCLYTPRSDGGFKSKCDDAGGILGFTPTTNWTPGGSGTAMTAGTQYFAKYIYDTGTYWEYTVYDTLANAQAGLLTGRISDSWTGTDNHAIYPFEYFLIPTITNGWIRYI